ncbi:hypothetical protein, partial [Klebsiella pneumoniae]|uniref:hypothetical protein n=1 Tax=Klebsiella pneumoniae TaxID=573 RepID=UPI00396915EA
GRQAPAEDNMSIGLVVFLSTFFGLVACQAGPEVLSAPIMGYNHTPAAINEFTVNGAGGPRSEAGPECLLQS